MQSKLLLVQISVCSQSLSMTSSVKDSLLTRNQQWQSQQEPPPLKYVSDYFTAVFLLCFLPEHQYKKPALSPIVDDSEFERARSSLTIRDNDWVAYGEAALASEV